MNVRAANAADRETVHALYSEFFAELPPPPYDTDTLEQELREVDEILRDGIALVVDEGSDALGFALATVKGPRHGYVSDLYVRPAARRRGVAKALLRGVAEAFDARGVDHVTLDVDSANGNARAVYERLGFREQSLRLVVETERLAARLVDERPLESFGGVHVQTDDAGAVERAVRQFVPRLGRSGGSVVVPPADGWTAVYDDLCDRDPRLLRRLARELSDRLGAVALALGVEDGAVARFILYDRGAIADEYASVPEYHGPLPPGDVVALRANPTVIARLTGSDPQRVRAAARAGASPADLPPPRELLAAIAAAIGLGAPALGYAEAVRLPGVVRIAHG